MVRPELCCLVKRLPLGSLGVVSNMSETSNDTIRSVVPRSLGKVK